MSRMDEIAMTRTAEELYKLGKEYRDGTKDSLAMPTTAVKYFTKAAEKGHLEAKYDLACMYEQGIGCEVDIDKAKEYYNSAAYYGHNKAKRALKRLER